jgi:hypothetical protein
LDRALLASWGFALSLKAMSFLILSLILSMLLLI